MQKVLINNRKTCLAWLLAILSILVCDSSLFAQTAGPDDSGSGLPWHKAPDGYYMTRMDVRMTVKPDHTYEVTELMHLNFLEQKHGIIRDIPTGFWVNRDASEQQDGSRLVMRYNQVEVEDFRASVESMPRVEVYGFYEYRLGSADVTLYGPQVFMIRYTLRLPGDRIDVADQFYHSVLGSGWNCAIDTFVYEVNFEKAVPQESLSQLIVLTGREGEDIDCTQTALSSATEHQLTGYRTDIGSYEALTLMMPLPEGYFDPQDLPFDYNLGIFFAVLTGLVLAFLLYQIIKGDEHVTPVVAVRPPKCVLPAEVGVIIDGEVDDEDMMSMIPYLAAEDKMQIEYKDDDHVVLKLKQALDDGSPAYLDKLFRVFFDKKMVFDLKENEDSASFGNQWENAFKKLEQHTEKYMGTMSKYLLQVLAMVILLPLTLACAYAGEHTFRIWIMAQGGLVSVLIAYFFWYLGRKELRMRNAVEGCATIAIYCILAFFYLGGLLLFFMAFRYQADYYLPLEVIYGLGIATLAVVFFIKRLYRMSEERKKQLPEVLGLKQFIETADKDRLKMLLDEDEQYFYRILPYAIAFGMADQWVSKFDGLKVAPSNAFGNATGASIRPFIDTKNYSRHINRATAKASDQRLAASSSSGSHRSSGSSYRYSSRGGSRGRSGGGSGGGGGRSW